MLILVFNFVDRQIIAILAEHIRADLGLDDAQLGFLYGTAFAVVFALFGLPLGRLADLWSRTGVIALATGAWSLMTVLSAAARTFGQLAAARVGVGIGEAGLTPAAHSLLSDYFPPNRRAAIIGIYSSGLYVGAGLSLAIGGVVADWWGWRAAFLVAGLPGLGLALWVRTMPEPRPAHAPARPAFPFGAFAAELRAVLPPFAFLDLVMARAWAAAALNLAAGAAIGLAAWLLTVQLGTAPQWIAMGLGIYAALSWATLLARRDPAVHVAIFRNRTLTLAVPGFALLAFTGYGVGFWIPPLVMRVHGASAAQAGAFLGGGAALGGLLGVIVGGWWADRWRRRSPRGRLFVGVCAALLPLPFLGAMSAAPSAGLVFASYAPFVFFTSIWIGAGAATVQELVPPQVRSTASAVLSLMFTLLGLAMGPYTIGRLSMATGDLRTAILFVGLTNLVAVMLLLWAGRSIERDQSRAADGAFGMSGS